MKTNPGTCLIIGGGIHGTLLGVQILKSGTLRQDDLRIVDPNESLISRWKTNTTRIGMRYLRSPSVHHLDLDPFSLRKFSNDQDGTDFLGRYKRPSLDLFHEHCQALIEETGLAALHHQGSVSGLTRDSDDLLHVTLASGETTTARQVIVATGMNEMVAWPEWACGLQDAGGHVEHVFHEAEDVTRDSEAPIVITGGGITAAHTALKLSKEYPGQVTLLTRHSLRTHDFDSDPGWLGPKYMNGFSQLKDNQRRRQTIRMARYRGSVPPEIKRALVSEEAKGNLHLCQDEVDGTTVNHGHMLLHLQSGDTLHARTVILATGYRQECPIPDWLKIYGDDFDLPYAPCGTPVVDQNLSWHDGIYLTGALAELELGPTARNIAGARQAAARMIPVLKQAPLPVHQ
ncbi:FAD/NAD(P)-binding protein [Salisediminibacterium beveridgei]|uniref:FAD-dependent urate hydroxylase HpyO/Asp monooxygenase CreE-like FAD/NAD(P)-binding domain-containing protein n=1 Tax=Salisediminibacterium beveridgei TaxID=632773 RepID=A0A1D7QY48_9BACI|nr:FAD/NAD(P)-binding protein [Salisediminibacterium beveridgei]AOM83932.1 hypothetical protein BBEV_2593 [Salisediminibacterium beveridgei]